MAAGFPFDREQELSRIRAAVEAVGPQLRRLPRAAAIERLEVSLRVHGVFLPQAAVEALVRTAGGSGWVLRHPIQAVRDRRRRSGECGDEELERLEHESGELMRKLDDLLAPDAFEYLSSSSRRSVDGVVHVVAIRPWSESAAAHIRALAAPITVTIETPDHDQPDQPTSVGLPVHGRDHEHESR